jgi:hypothetical protein
MLLSMEADPQDTLQNLPEDVPQARRCDIYIVYLILGLFI